MATNVACSFYMTSLGTWAGRGEASGELREYHLMGQKVRIFGWMKHIGMKLAKLPWLSPANRTSLVGLKIDSVFARFAHLSVLRLTIINNKIIFGSANIL